MEAPSLHGIKSRKLGERRSESQYGNCLYHFGGGGSGHFVKMVHNGIEYAEMQLIAETYDLMSRGMGILDQELSVSTNVLMKDTSIVF